METETRKDKPENVQFIVYEAAQARAERTSKRLIYALVIAVLLIFASNGMWLYAWMQYDYTSETTTTETVTVDGKDGIASYANNGGSVVNGNGETGFNNNPTQDADEEGWITRYAQTKVIP